MIQLETGSIRAPDIDAPTLELEGFGVAYGARVVLARVNLRIADREVLVLMGPGGAGKSTLLRTLAGRNDSDPTLRVWGRARYAGQPWVSTSGPPLLAQTAQDLVSTLFQYVASGLRDRANFSKNEQRDRVRELLDRYAMRELEADLDTNLLDLGRTDRRLATLAHCLAADPPLLMLDEPTAELPVDDRARVVASVRAAAATRAVLFVTHNRQDALSLGGTTALLAGGEVLEQQATRDFFASPRSESARTYVETGGLGIASPPPLSESELERLASRPMRRSSSSALAAHAPLGIRWIEEGKLAGVRRPGLLGKVEDDLRALRDGGIRVLVCLEESQSVPPTLLAAFGIDGLSLPIVDMDVPSVAEATAMCRAIRDAIDAGAAVALHCRAGLGRTGTMLAAYLIFTGATAVDALQSVRAVEHRFVQSELQQAFLIRFAADVREQ